MEGIDTYEKSYKEISRVLKTLSSDSVSIDFKKLDNITASAIRTALKEVIIPRMNGISMVLSGDKKF